MALLFFLCKVRQKVGTSKTLNAGKHYILLKKKINFPNLQRGRALCGRFFFSRFFSSKFELSDRGRTAPVEEAEKHAKDLYASCHSLNDLLNRLTSYIVFHWSFVTAIGCSYD